MDSLFPDIDPVHACSLLLSKETEQEGITRIYESLQKDMKGSKSDTGLYPTPLSLARFMVEIAQPQPYETIYDPACGLDGFFVETYRYLRRADRNISNVFLGYDINPRLIEAGKAWMKANGIDTMHIREQSLPAIDKFRQNLWDDNDDRNDDDDKFEGRYVILTHPPYEKITAQSVKKSIWRANKSVEHYDWAFLRHCMDTLQKHPSGRCGTVVSQSFFNSPANKMQRYELVTEYNIQLIVRLPKKLFATRQRGVNYPSYLLYFDKQGATGQILHCNIHEDEATVPPRTRQSSAGARFEEAISIWKRWQEQSMEKSFSLTEEEQQYTWVTDASTIHERDPEYKLIDDVPFQPYEKPLISLDELMQRLVQQTGELHELAQQLQKRIKEGI